MKKVHTRFLRGSSVKMSLLFAFLSVAAALSLQAKPAATAKASPEEAAAKKLEKVLVITWQYDQLHFYFSLLISTQIFVE